MGLGPGRGAPVEHVVVIVKENHTCSQLFSSRSQARGCGPCAALCSPSHAAALRDRVPGRCACRFTPRQTELYRRIAARFARSARHFTEVLGPSDPNHYMLMAAESPIVDNRPRGAPLPDMETLADRFAAAGLSWRNYAGQRGAGLAMVAHLNRSPWQRGWQDFARDAGSGELPQLAWLTPPFAQSEHPPAPFGWGQSWTARQLQALMSGPAWRSSVAFVVWDDWGGYADPVEPPLVERWKDGSPFRYGRRCPLLIVSPFARRGLVYRGLSSHVSLAAFCEAVFGLPPLTARDAAANPLLDCFDWADPDPAPVDLRVPPPGLWERAASPLLDLGADLLDS